MILMMETSDIPPSDAHLKCRGRESGEHLNKSSTKDFYFTQPEFRIINIGDRISGDIS